MWVYSSHLLLFRIYRQPISTRARSDWLLAISTVDDHRRRRGVVVDAPIYVRLPVPGDGSRPKLVNKDDGNVRAARRRVVVISPSSRGGCLVKWSGNVPRVSRLSKKARETPPCDRRLTNCWARCLACATRSARWRIGILPRGPREQTDGRTDGRMKRGKDRERERETDDNPRSRVHIVRYEFPLFLAGPSRPA